MRLYLYDDQRISTGEHVDIEDVYAPVPAYATHVQPPSTSGDEVAHWNGKVWTVLPERPPAPVSLDATRITKLAFRNRFTATEKAMLEMAALDDPAAAMPDRMQAATIRAYLADVAAATFIDLSRPDTRAGVQTLEAAGLLAEGRATDILDSPVLPEERPL